MLRKSEEQVSSVLRKAVPLPPSPSNTQTNTLTTANHTQTNTLTRGNHTQANEPRRGKKDHGNKQNISLPKVLSLTPCLRLLVTDICTLAKQTSAAVYVSGDDVMGDLDAFSFFLFFKDCL